MVSSPLTSTEARTVDPRAPRAPLIAAGLCAACHRGRRGARAHAGRALAAGDRGGAGRAARRRPDRRRRSGPGPRAVGAARDARGRLAGGAGGDARRSARLLRRDPVAGARRRHRPPAVGVGSGHRPADRLGARDPALQSARQGLGQPARRRRRSDPDRGRPGARGSSRSPGSPRPSGTGATLVLESQVNMRAAGWIFRRVAARSPFGEGAMNVTAAYVVLRAAVERALHPNDSSARRPRGAARRPRRRR